MDIQELNKILTVAIKKDPRIALLVKKYQSQPDIIVDLLGDVILKIQEEMNPWKWKPVHPSVFLNDKYYCGKDPDTGEGVASTMYDNLKKEFIKVHCENSNVREVVLTGCVHLDSLIVESDGNMPTLREKIESNREVDVIAINNNIDKSKTSNTRFSGNLKCYEIVLQNGMKVVLTPEHKIEVYNNKRTWKEASNLRIGEFVVVPRILKTFPSENCSLEMAKLYAYIMTNGCFDETRLRYNSANEKTSEEFLSIIREFGFNGKVYTKNGTLEFHSTNYAKSGLKAFLKRMFNSERKVIDVPACIARSSNEIVSVFLNRLIAAEGCVYSGNENTPPRIQLAMVNERFIRQVQLLFLRFGIQSRIKELFQYDKRVNKERSIWILIISGIQNLELFFNKIGYVLGKEYKCEEVLRYCQNKESNTNVDVMPFKAKSLSKMMTISSIERKAGSKWYNKLNICGNLSRKVFDEWLSEFGDTVLGKKLNYLFPSDIGYSRVVSIRELDGLHPTGDLGATNGNRFTANGISVHNSIGWGKSFFMELGLVWHLYLLSCYKNPQLFFKLSPASKIALTIISITEKQAKSNMFFAIKQMIKQIPYFKENYMFDDKRASESLLFQNGIELFSGSSAISSTIGLNIYSAALDEANFFKNIQNSKRSKESGGDYDEALALYNNLLKRQESRFLKYGLKPGVLYIGSSRQFPNDFTEQRIKIAREVGDTTTHILDYNLWTMCPDKYSTETFLVEVGQLNKKSRILDGHETDISGQIIKVPIDFKSKFHKDLNNSLRDLAGVAVYSVQPFFAQKEYVVKMFDPSIKRIFSVDKATLSPKPEYQVSEKILKTVPEFPDKPRYVGMDIGLKKDRFGFSMGYIESMVYQEKEFFNEETQKMDFVKERVPKIVIEMVLEIYPEREFGEVELSRVRFLIFQLKKLGYNIRYSSADGFQSKDMDQILRRKGINHEYISMDKTTEPYETARQMIYNGNVRCIYHQKLEEEMFLLERDYVNDKVDHPVRFSKDISDAVCQVIYNCTVNPHFMDDALLGGSMVYNDGGESLEKTKQDIIDDFEKWARM